MAFDADEMGSGVSNPTLKITENIGDGVVLDITSVDHEVKGTTDPKTGEADVNMVITGTVTATKGQPLKTVDGAKVAVAKGDVVALWCAYAIDTRDGRQRKLKPVTRAITDACRAAKVKAPEAGGQLTIEHHALGDPPKNPMFSRAKLCQATYKPPAPVAAAAGGFDAGAWD